VRDRPAGVLTEKQSRVQQQSARAARADAAAAIPLVRGKLLGLGTSAAAGHSNLTGPAQSMADAHAQDAPPS
jgi:hypothetical protein